MRRREFLTLVGGTAAAWPLAAQAQPDRLRRIGVLAAGTENDQITQASIAALREELATLGWVQERNLRIELRFGGADADRFPTYAAELVRLAPDVIVTESGATTRAVLQQTRTIPVVITGAGDLLVTGIVKSLARPEGNVTGVTNLYSSIGGKWLELLKEAVPRVERAALIYNPPPPELATEGGSSYVRSIEDAARALAVKTIKLPYRDAVDIVRAIDAFAAEPNGGLIVVPPPPSRANREAILRLATQHRLPTIYSGRPFAAEGGLMAYGTGPTDRFRRAASFVDRILRGAKVSELPVEYPTKFDLVINLKTAKALGLSIPASLLARADEVIE
jgi:putative tryptophan/tyrosine transport system substrate-binding protein